jgi:4-alpha-glucanotransferase
MQRPEPLLPTHRLLERRAVGVLLHPSSLPGPHGSGDLGAETRHFVDWLVSAGQSVWQMLPTTPIGPGNSPYQSASAFAGSECLVALQPLVERGWLAHPVLPHDGFDARRVRYEQVLPWRLQQLRAAHAGFRARAGAAERTALRDWCATASGWLDDYALFMALERAHRGRPWWQWPAAQAQREPAALQRARSELAEEIAFWSFVQWCFDTQLAALKAYANQRGVALMGDLPIFVAHHSADCWARPELYELDAQWQPTVVAGVPPDRLGPLGQRWCNPLYRWDRMADDGFAWWTARMRRAFELADVVRIDHFRGFAAYWEVPADAETAQIGRWVTGPGQALFDALGRALGPLPIVAEDLGTITPDVHALRRACGFPGMKVLQYAFGDDATHDYLPHNIEPGAVVYTGTHDAETARGWWQHASVRERAFAGTYLACGAHDVHWAMVRAACNSAAHTVIVPLQDVLGLDNASRMNLPGTMGAHNWSWRFDWAMVGSEPGRVLRLISAASGRCPFALLGLPP